ncbi:MAG: TetR/AcrR family transcriptional regulator [Planctomycetota bacterium]|nr:TetR/AcrR family transcriptional regulator [Planctomycetota bacterium]
METLRERIRGEQRESARMAFMKAAEKLIAERGFEKTGVQDIAAATGYSAGSFYLFFKSKEQMYEELLCHHCRELVGRLRESRKAAGSPIAQFRATVRALVEYFNGNRDFFRIYYSLTPGWDNPATGKGDAAKRLLLEFLEEMKAMYAEGRRRGDFRRDVTPDQMVLFAHGAVSFMLLSWSLQAGDGELPPPAEQERILADLILNGIAGRRR